MLGSSVFYFSVSSQTAALLHKNLSPETKLKDGTILTAGLLPVLLFQILTGNRCARTGKRAKRLNGLRIAA